jgi:ribosome recycling factor
MGLLDILTFPVSGPINFVTWLAEKIAEQMDNEFYSEEAIRRQLLDLELKFDLGEISEDDDKRFKKTIQELTDKFCKEIDTLLSSKKDEIMKAG